jgi:hypothetical protein
MSPTTTTSNAAAAGGLILERIIRFALNTVDANDLPLCLHPSGRARSAAAPILSSSNHNIATDGSLNRTDRPKTSPGRAVRTTCPSWEFRLLFRLGQPLGLLSPGLTAGLFGSVGRSAAGHDNFYQRAARPWRHPDRWLRLTRCLSRHLRYLRANARILCIAMNSRQSEGTHFTKKTSKRNRQLEHLYGLEDWPLISAFDLIAMPAMRAPDGCGRGDHVPPSGW